MYGNRLDTTEGLVPIGTYLGAFGVVPPAPIAGNTTIFMVQPNRLKEISDGTSNTVLISEGVAPLVSGWGGPIGGIIYGNMGGSLFSNRNTPNAGVDSPIGPCPLDVGDTEYFPPCLSVGPHPGNGPGGATAHVHRPQQASWRR